MFYCALHSWYSSEEPCPACHKKYDVITTTTTSPEEKKEIVQRDWEIVEFFNREPGLEPSHENIKSVNRLRDNEVFSIGDFIKVHGGVRKGWSDPIKEFVIVGEEMVCGFETWRMPLNSVERMHKDIHITQPQPTTDTFRQDN